MHCSWLCFCGLATFVVAVSMLTAVQWRVLTFEDGMSMSQRAETSPHFYYLAFGVYTIMILTHRVYLKVIFLCYTISVYSRLALFGSMWVIGIALITLATANMRDYHDIHLTASTVYFCSQGVFAFVIIRLLHDGVCYEQNSKKGLLNIGTPLYLVYLYQGALTASTAGFLLGFLLINQYIPNDYYIPNNVEAFLELSTILLEFSVIPIMGVNCDLLEKRASEAGFIEFEEERRVCQRLLYATPIQKIPLPFQKKIHADEMIKSP
eukprot:Platyproteum_vivax@DN6927_c0_g1_i1.p1